MKNHTLLETYNALYKEGRFWTRTLITGGRHTVVFHKISGMIRGKNVLDAFVGGGRLAVMIAPRAQQVDTYDFSPQASLMFGALKRAAGERACRNISFAECDTAGYRPVHAPYDVIVIAGTLENLDDPDADIRRLTQWLKKGGRLVIASPSFFNPRGAAYNVLHRFLGYPMTKTDKRQVDDALIGRICRDFGYRQESKTGLSFMLGWGGGMAEDLRERMPLACRDARVAPNEKKRRDFEAWLDEAARLQEDMVRAWARRGDLKRIPRPGVPRLRYLAAIPDAKVRALVAAYYTDDLSRDPYYADKPPFNGLGGNTVYILKKK